MMNDPQQQKNIILFALLITALLIAFIYARQRLFTRTEPIVLAT
jgi:hypothetical protein